MKDTFRGPNMDTPASYPTRAHKDLFEAVLALKTPDECAKFFRDLLTMAELNEFANRWQTVKLLEKRKPYSEIAKLLATSTATVTRVAHWLNHGMGGYRLIADRIFPRKTENTKPAKRQMYGKRRLF